MTPVVPDPVLSVANLRVSFGQAEAVRGVTLAVARGETHCLVGESGCGKSVTALSVMNLLPRGIARTADHLRFQGQDLLGMSERQTARLRGDKMAMIFQEPMTSLNPAYTIGSQMSEVFERHRGATPRQARDSAAELFAAATHLYTRGLLDCIPVPGMTRTGEPLGNIPGVVPRIAPGFVGCGFRDRCTLATPECARTVPLRDAGGDHRYLCQLPPDWKRAAAA